MNEPADAWNKKVLSDLCNRLMAAKDSFILTKDIPNILDMAVTLCSVLWDKQTFLHFLKLNQCCCQVVWQK